MARKNKKKLKHYYSKINAEQNNSLLEYANKSNNEIFHEFNTSIHGLTNDRYEKLKEEHGLNNITTKKARHWYNYFISAFINPFSIILIIIACLNLLTMFITNSDHDGWISFGIIMGMLILSGTIKLFQEVRSSKASEKLKDMIKTTTAIERNDIRMEIAIEDVVPGDLIHLAAGDMIPADMIIIQAKDLFVTQSALTGESEPIEKIVGNPNNTKYKNALDCNNLCFMGTSVSSGSAIGVVLNTGQNTFFGKVGRLLSKKRPKTNFDKGLRRVSLLLLITILIMTIVIFILQGALHKSIDDVNSQWIQALTFALALAIGLTPEMLPMIVSVNLAKEAFRLSKQKTIVKNINSIQSFGAMDVLCTDKTGTLTEDRIVVERYVNIENKTDTNVLLYGYLNSYFQTGLKNLLDVSIINKSKEMKIDDECNKYVKVDEIPFDFQRRRMSVVVKRKSNGERLLITKGAPEEILSICSHVQFKNKIIPLTTKIINRVKSIINSLNENGMRVVAIATNYEELKTESFAIKDENNMTLMGLAAFLDPPKITAKKAILGLQRKGVQIKVLTGDNEAVTKYICSQVGINAKKILLGNQIDDMSNDELKNVVNKVNIFAKLSPEQKARVISVIKSNKHIVGFMGDGINDAAAMREADIGISVDTAVDVAKESADIILLEKDLTILTQGVLEGRKTYANIIKYIKISVSSSFGNMLSMLVASLWLPFQPMMAVQILILNLIYEFSQFMVPWDNVDVDFLAKPRNWSARSILKFMLVMGPVSSIFDIVSFSIMYYGLHWGYNKDTSTIIFFQTGWFLVSLLTQTLIIIILRTKHVPLFKSYPSTPVSLSLTILMIVGFILVLTPGLQPIFGSLTFHKGVVFIGCSFAIAACYTLTAQFTKMGYVKMFNSWL